MERREKMPLLRYFVFVGAALLALLFAADAYLPKLPEADRTRVARSEISGIRIHSDRKWPERVVFDTSLPTITPASARVEASVSAATTLAELPAKARARDAFAQVQPPGSLAPEPTDPRRPEPKPQRKRKVIAKSHAGPPTMLVAQQPRFGLFGNAIW